MPNHDKQQGVEITQADREAAANLLIEKSRNCIIECKSAEIRRGDNDSHYWVQAFARHRLSTPAPGIEVLVEALAEAREALHQHYVDWDGEPEDAVPLQLARSKCDAALATFSAMKGKGNG
ncbi:MAG: hypothetical protein J7498_05585 [Sphingobium sp.]|nr:hypothetical protein [Sphingobium sp.]